MRVFANVAQNIGQLKGDTALLCQNQRLHRFEAKDVNDGQPNDRGHVVAIIVEFLERLNPARFDIRGDAIDHFVKEAVRD